MPTQPTKPPSPNSVIDLSELKSKDFEPVKPDRVGKGLAKLATLPKKKKAKK